jgi:hypothetical protein
MRELIQKKMNVWNLSKGEGRGQTPNPNFFGDHFGSIDIQIWGQFWKKSIYKLPETLLCLAETPSIFVILDTMSYPHKIQEQSLYFNIVDLSLF